MKKWNRKLTFETRKRLTFINSNGNIFSEILSSQNLVDLAQILLNFHTVVQSQGLFTCFGGINSRVVKRIIPGQNGDWN